MGRKGCIRQLLCVEEALQQRKMRASLIDSSLGGRVLSSQKERNLLPCVLPIALVGAVNGQALDARHHSRVPSAREPLGWRVPFAEAGTSLCHLVSGFTGSWGGLSSPVTPFAPQFPCPSPGDSERGVRWGGGSTSALLLTLTCCCGCVAFCSYGYG